MSLILIYPSVPSFPQSSILLKEREGRDRTPTETTPGAFLIAAAQKPESPGVHTYWLKRVDGAGLEFWD